MPPCAPCCEGGTRSSRGAGRPWTEATRSTRRRPDDNDGPAVTLPVAPGGRWAAADLPPMRSTVSASHLPDRAVVAMPLTEAERTCDCDWSRSQGWELTDVFLTGPRSQPASAHALVLEELRHYLFAGGVPAASSPAAGGLSHHAAFARQDALTQSCRDDFGKYAPRADKRCSDEVLVFTARGSGRQVMCARLAPSTAGAFSGR